MTRDTIRLYVLLVTLTLCLLTLATSTFAEGAWTLWMMGASSPWDSVVTFSTRKLCMDALHQQAQAVEKLGLKVTEACSRARRYVRVRIGRS